MSNKLNPQNYFRLPWSLTDNGISWLEVTTKCNLACKGCYRDPKKDGHKSLIEIADDLETFKRYRKSDCMSIAGGDPLVHPNIVEIVRMIKEGGWKPILNTNGLALTKDLLLQLKDAGVAGFTFHIDTTQDRSDSKAILERDHNKLRQSFAEMISEVGNIACSFNQTVSESTIDQIPDMVRWAKARPDIINSIVFILYREPSMAKNLDFFANGKKIKANESYNNTDFCGGGPIYVQDVVDQIRKIDPDFTPSSYLNGTVDPNSMKWTLAQRYATGNKTYGYASAGFMKNVQHFSHFFRNKWLSYSSPKALSIGRLAMFALALVDKGTKKSLFNFLKNPLNLFKKVHIQTFAIIQAIDFMEDGQMNMCDGCPDITAHKGKLYWSCRLEEIKEYGTFVSAYPKSKIIEKQHRKIEIENQISCQ